MDEIYWKSENVWEVYRRTKPEQEKKKGKWTDIEWITRKVLDYFTTYYDEEGEVIFLSETVSAEESMKGGCRNEEMWTTNEQNERYAGGWLIQGKYWWSGQDWNHQCSENDRGTLRLRGMWQHKWR